MNAKCNLELWKCSILVHILMPFNCNQNLWVLFGLFFVFVAGFKFCEILCRNKPFIRIIIFKKNAFTAEKILYQEWIQCCQFPLCTLYCSWTQEALSENIIMKSVLLKEYKWKAYLMLKNVEKFHNHKTIKKKPKRWSAG